jgi:hypothetical protein
MPYIRIEAASVRVWPEQRMPGFAEENLSDEELWLILTYLIHKADTSPEDLARVVKVCSTSRGQASLAHDPADGDTDWSPAASASHRLFSAGDTDEASSIQMLMLTPPPSRVKA